MHPPVVMGQPAVDSSIYAKYPQTFQNLTQSRIEWPALIPAAVQYATDYTSQPPYNAMQTDSYQRSQPNMENQMQYVQAAPVSIYSGFIKELLK